MADPHENERECNMCGWVPKDAVCDYDWSGRCTVKDFSFLRDGKPARSGLGAIQELCEKVIRWGKP